MSDRPVTFDRPSARRIAQAVRKVEQTPRGEPARPLPAGFRHPETLWARLTSRDSTDLWRYAWTEQRRKADGTWEDMPGGRAGTVYEAPALEAGLREDDCTDAIVLLTRTPTVDTGTTPASWALAWSFDAADAGGVDALSDDTLSVAAAPFVNLPAANGTDNVLAWDAHTDGDGRDGVSLQLQPGSAVNQTLRWTGSAWVIDYPKAY